MEPEPEPEPEPQPQPQPEPEPEPEARESGGERRAPGTTAPHQLPEPAGAATAVKHIDVVFTESPPLGIVWKLVRQACFLDRIYPDSHASTKTELRSGLELTHVAGNSIAQFTKANDMRGIEKTVRECPRPMTLTFQGAAECAAPEDPETEHGVAQSSGPGSVSGSSSGEESGADSKADSPLLAFRRLTPLLPDAIPRQLEKMGCDSSGKLAYSEVLQSAQELFQDVSETALKYAYRAAGLDDSASVAAGELAEVFEYVVFLNNVWHAVKVKQEDLDTTTDKAKFCHDAAQLVHLVDDVESQAEAGYESIRSMNESCEVTVDDFCTWCVKQMSTVSRKNRDIEYRARKLRRFNVRVCVNAAGPLSAFEMPLELQLAPPGDYCAAVQLWDGPSRCVEAWGITECRNMDFDRKHCIFSMRVDRTSNSTEPATVRMVVVDGVVAGRHILPAIGLVHSVGLSTHTAWRGNDATRGSQVEFTLAGAAVQGYGCFPVLYSGQLCTLLLRHMAAQPAPTKLDYLSCIQIWRGPHNCCKLLGIDDVCGWKLNLATGHLELEPQSPSSPLDSVFAKSSSYTLVVKGPVSNRKQVVKLLQFQDTWRAKQGSSSPSNYEYALQDSMHLPAVGIPEGVPTKSMRFGVLYRGEPVHLSVRPHIPTSAVQLWADKEKCITTRPVHDCHTWDCDVYSIRNVRIVCYPAAAVQLWVPLRDPQQQNIAAKQRSGMLNGARVADWSHVERIRRARQSEECCIAEWEKADCHAWDVSTSRFSSRGADQRITIRCYPPAAIQLLVDEEKCIGSWGKDDCHHWDFDKDRHVLHLGLGKSDVELQIPSIDGDTAIATEITTVLREYALFALAGSTRMPRRRQTPIAKGVLRAS